MNKLILVAAVGFLAGCAETDRKTTGAEVFDRPRLIPLAKDELSRRRLELPRLYDVRVDNGEVGNEIGPPRPIYSVSFWFIYQGRKTEVYTVFIDKRSGKIDLVSDYRATVPSRI